MVKSRMRKMRQQAFEYIIPVVFLIVFTGIWWTVGFVTQTWAIVLIGLVPFALLILFGTVMVRNMKTYRSAKIAVEQGEADTAKVLKRSAYGVSTNHSASMYGVMVEYEVDGKPMRSWTTRIYTEIEADALEEKGTVNIKRKGKHIIVTDEIYIPYDEYFDEEDVAAEPASTSAYAAKRADRLKKPPTRPVSGNQRMKNLAKDGNKDAIDILAIPDMFDKMKFCALNNVDEEVLSALDTCILELEGGDKVRRQMQWYRTILSEISTLPLTESMRLVDYFMMHLETEEVQELINAVIKESKKTESFMLPSAVVRKLKEYQSALDYASLLRNSNKEETMRLLTLCKESVGNAMTFVCSVASENAAPEDYMEISTFAGNLLESES